MEFKRYFLKEVVFNFDNKRKPLSTLVRGRMEKLYPYYGANGIIDYVNDYIYEGKYLLIAEDGTVLFDNKYPVIYNVYGKFWVSNHAHVLQANEEIVNQDYLFYHLKGKNILSHITGAVQLKLNQENLNKIEIVVPSLLNQRKIAKILSDIDNKIDVNNKINENLQKLSQELYKHWFVDFEFHDENGKPYKKSGGKMVESELGKIPEGWLIKKISDLTNVFTGKKNANENNVDGKYKFFTCSPNNLMSDTYIFDGPAIIVAGNGAYTGRTRFYDGKFELYQRTYACTVKKDIDTINIYGLYIMMKLIVEPSYMGGTHGSAIPYIVMGDIADYKFSYDEKIFLDFSKIIENNIRKISNNERQNELLVQMRESLLPKLMNGEIDLEEIEI